MTDVGHGKPEDWKAGDDERRTPPQAQHVHIDGFANGGATFVAALAAEVNLMVRLLKWALATAGPLAMLAVIGIWNMSIQIKQLTSEVDDRPTGPMIEQMIQNRTRDLKEAITDDAAAGRVARDVATQGLNELSAAVEAIKVNNEAMRRDFEREHGRRP